MDGSTLLIIICYILAIVLYITGLWNIFKKAGESGWFSIVPIFNGYTMYKIAWGNGWLFFLNVLGFVPVVGAGCILMLHLITSYKLSCAYGHGWGYAIGLIFLPFIFTLVLGLDKQNKYIGVKKI